MDFARKLDQAQNLSDLFELVKRAVEAVLGRTRAGLMLALADLGNHPQGFLGAFTLMFIGAGSILSPGGSNLLLVAFAHGLAIGVMVSALARISGGHFNPAVTLGALVGRQITPRLAAVYWGSQLLGALVAAF